jgi:membrane protein
MDAHVAGPGAKLKHALLDLLWLPTRNVISLLPAAFWEWRKNAASRLAAALAFYTVFSLAPTLIIALAIAGAALGEGVVRLQVLQGLHALLGEIPARFAMNVVDAAAAGLTGRWAVTAVVTMLLGATVVFTELHEALNEVWNVQSRRGVRGFFYRRLMGFLMVLLVGVVLLASLAADTSFSAVRRVIGGMVGAPTLWQTLHVVGSFVIMTFLFALVYKLLPDIYVAWQDALPASAVTSVLFAVGRYLIGLYLANTTLGSVCWAAGSFVIILLWIYYSAQIFLFGAQLSCMYANRFGSRAWSRPRNL